MLTAHQFDRFGKKLHALRARLDTRAESLRADACHGAGAEDAGGISNAPIHLGDLGSQEEAVVVNLGLAMNEVSLRKEVDDAILRLDGGIFGICEACGNEIASERLEALPYARLCIHCAEPSQHDVQNPG